MSYTALEAPEKPKPVASIDEILPLAPVRTGITSGMDGNVAVYVTHSRGKRPILIAPHALLLMTATVSASRLVTDPKAISKVLSGLGALHKSPNHRSLTHLSTRLKIILGLLSENASVRSDLLVIGDRLKEGSTGITARDTLRWFGRALMEVESRGSTALTPDIVHETFKWFLNNDGFVESKPQNTAEWYRMHLEVLKDIVLPSLFSDIRAIISGDAEKFGGFIVRSLQNALL